MHLGEFACDHAPNITCLSYSSNARISHYSLFACMATFRRICFTGWSSDPTTFRRLALVRYKTGAMFAYSTVRYKTTHLPRSAHLPLSAWPLCAVRYKSSMGAPSFKQVRDAIRVHRKMCSRYGRDQGHACCLPMRWGGVRGAHRFVASPRSGELAETDEWEESLLI